MYIKNTIPIVSVIIINYNKTLLTLECIRSVVSQSRDFEYEIILVDNGSDRFDQQLFIDQFPDIKVISSNLNLGFAGGNNLGIKYANGDYILLLNNDTLLENNAIGLTLEAMTEQNIKLATCQVLNENRTIQPVCSFYPSIRFSLLGLLGVIQVARKLGIKGLSFEYDYSKQQPVEWIWGCFFMFRREVLELFPRKKLPEDFFMYGEDMLWCYLLKEKRVIAWFLPSGKIIHLFSGNKSSQDPSLNSGIMNAIIFLKRYYPKWRYVLIFFFDTLIAMSRLRLKFLFKKVQLYFSLN